MTEFLKSFILFCLRLIGSLLMFVLISIRWFFTDGIYLLVIIGTISTPFILWYLIWRM